MKKVTYLSQNKSFRAEQTEENLQVCSFFNVYNVKTNLRVAVLNAEDGTYRFTDTDSSLDTNQMEQLISLATNMQLKIS